MDEQSGESKEEEVMGEGIGESEMEECFVTLLMHMLQMSLSSGDDWSSSIVL